MLWIFFALLGLCAISYFLVLNLKLTLKIESQGSIAKSSCPDTPCIYTPNHISKNLTELSAFALDCTIDSASSQNNKDANISNLNSLHQEFSISNPLQPPKHIHDSLESVLTKSLTNFHSSIESDTVVFQQEPTSILVKEDVEKAIPISDDFLSAATKIPALTKKTASNKTTGASFKSTLTIKKDFKYPKAKELVQALTPTSAIQINHSRIELATQPLSTQVQQQPENYHNKPTPVVDIYSKYSYFTGYMEISPPFCIKSWYSPFETGLDINIFNAFYPYSHNQKPVPKIEMRKPQYRYDTSRPNRGHNYSTKSVYAGY